MMDEEYHSDRPCRYDRYSPCEGCGKCWTPEEDPDPDREYELARDEGRGLTT